MLFAVFPFIFIRWQVAHAAGEGDAVMGKDPGAFQSLHFEIVKLADGVYAAIHKNGGGAICNAGIVDLGDRTLIFDTFLTPQAARDLIIAAEALIGKSISTVVNSHGHNDHIWGNQVFGPEVSIVSTSTTRSTMSAEGSKECAWYKENTQRRLASLEERYESAVDEQERNDISLWLTYYRQLAEAIPTLEVVLPNLTFDKRLVIHGARRSVELIEYRNGHTKSDIIMHLLPDSIIFMGDLLFVRSHPYLGDGDPDSLLQILQEIESAGATAFVPGHGPVGSSKDLQELVDYVETCRRIVKRMVSDGQGEDAIDNITVPPTFNEWQQEVFFRSNLHFLYKQMVKKQD